MSRDQTHRARAGFLACSGLKARRVRPSFNLEILASGPVGLSQSARVGRLPALAAAVEPGQIVGR
jgi:hypothetical protein